MVFRSPILKAILFFCPQTKPRSRRGEKAKKLVLGMFFYSLLQYLSRLSLTLSLSLSIPFSLSLSLFLWGPPSPQSAVDFMWCVPIRKSHGNCPLPPPPSDYPPAILLGPPLSPVPPPHMTIGSDTVSLYARQDFGVCDQWYQIWKYLSFYIGWISIKQ